MQTSSRRAGGKLVTTLSESRKKIIAGALLLAAVLALSSCGTEAEAQGYTAPEAAVSDEERQEYLRSSLEAMAMPPSDGAASASNDYISIDISGANQGCFSVDCSRVGSRKLKLGVTKDGETYYYNLFESAEPVYFPFQLGDGYYTITVYEHIEGARYSPELSCEAAVSLENEFSPFLLPSQQVNYSRSSEAVNFSFELTLGAEGDLEKVERVFDYLVSTIKYDNAKARAVENGELVGYIPDIDETLETKKGICYDYSALFAAMLRANGIPAKLVMGYVFPDDIYHAWNLIYTTDAGWVAKEIRFDGSDWSLADATFGSGEGGKASYEPVYEY